MRYDTPLFFVKMSGKEYNPDTGKWQEGELVKTKKYADVTHMGNERQQLAFGEVRSNRFTVRLQRPYNASYDYLEMDGKTFTVETKRCPSDKQSLVVVQNG